MTRRKASDGGSFATIRGSILGVILGYLLCAISSQAPQNSALHRYRGFSLEGSSDDAAIYDDVKQRFVRRNGRYLVEGEEEETNVAHSEENDIKESENKSEEGVGDKLDEFQAEGEGALKDNEEEEKEGEGEKEGEEEKKGKEEKEGEEEEEEIDMAVTSTSIICIILILIILTIAFEEGKETVTEYADRSMEPIIESLFGEMTVLGFLSVFTFVVTKAGFFEALSEKIFGDGAEEKEELTELFENVHFSLFFIMVCFVFQVLMLVKEGMQTEREWLTMDRNARDEEYMASIGVAAKEARDRRSFRSNLKHANSYAALFPGTRNVKSEHIEDEILFFELREEFLKERGVNPPFKPADVANRVGNDFNFGRYLSMCQGTAIAHIVEVDKITWLIIASFAVIFYLISLAAKENMLVLGWVWCLFAWCIFLFNIKFENHLIRVRSAFASTTRSGRAMRRLSVPMYGDASGPPSGQPVFPEGSGLNGETTYLVPMNDVMPALDMTLPAWTRVDMKRYMAQRSWFTRCIVGNKKPDRHNVLFWLEGKGPKFYFILLQINLLFVGIYLALLLLAFFPRAYEGYNIFGFLGYLIFALVPVVWITGNKKHLVAVLTTVTSMGTMRRPQVVSSVIREEKTARVVRAFIVLYKMHRAAANGFKKPSKGIDQDMPLHYSRSFDRLEIIEVGKTFDAFDKSGDGNISYEELRSIMSSLGAPMSDEALTNMVSQLDADGDGEISKGEFLQWYSEQLGDDEHSTHERAKFLFNLFDDDNSGEITIGEFKSTLDAFNIGFTFDEVGDLVKELDEDGNGVIGMEEFEELLERYHPQESDKAHY